MRTWIEVVLRWTHVLAGMVWIGHTYFFSLVNAPAVETCDAHALHRVVPQLMTRAHYWLRWGAVYAWTTGILLLGLVYSMQRAVMLPPESTLGAGAATGIGLGVLVVGFAVYDAMWRALERRQTAGAIASFVLLVAVAFGLARTFTGRAMLVHVGAMLGTMMAANVWMRIWPAQRAITAAIRAGRVPNAALASRAQLRSKHNTYMSVPLLFLMISNHYPSLYGGDLAWVLVASCVGVGWAITKCLYSVAEGQAPARFEPRA